LSSAELAWAVDTQELYIGNGSVAEGAPYVGNTKVLTEHDNILELASSYRFASDDPSITESEFRSLQSKIDEIEVSVADFGAINDGSTDCVAAFETAFTQLFRNTNENYKKVLKIPNGEYLFASDLEIPDGVIIRGETPLGTILNIDTNNITFVTSTGLTIASFNSSNRPKNISIDNLTIQRSSGQLVLSGLADSSFTNTVFKGEYQLGNAVSNYATEPAAVFWNNDIAGTKVTGIKFSNCRFESNSISVKCNQSVVTDTEIFFDRCDFFVNDTGIFISGIADQGNHWKVRDSEFREIATSAFTSDEGTGTKIERCNFEDVGNGTNTAATPLGAMVSFGDNRNNIVVDCSTNRLQNATIVSDASINAVTEVYNSSLTKLSDRGYETIYLSDSYRPLAVISAHNSFTIINYHLKLGPINGQYSRIGQLIIGVGDDLAGTDDITSLSITDNYQFSPTFLTSEGGSLMTNFEFRAVLADNDNDSGIETVVLSYRNPLASGSTGSISFDISYGV
jgi:hypothetical protein